MMVMGGALTLFSKSMGHLLTLAPLQSILSSSSSSKEADDSSTGASG